MLLTSAAAHAHTPAPEHALGAPSYAASLVSRSRSRSRAADNDDATAAAPPPPPPSRSTPTSTTSTCSADPTGTRRCSASSTASGTTAPTCTGSTPPRTPTAPPAASSRTWRRWRPSSRARGGGGGGGGGRPFALVLEDDFEWSDAAVARERLRAAFALQANWSVILLACRGVPAPLRDGALAGRYESAAGCFTTSGYMIRTSYAPKLLERFRSADRARRAPGGSASRSWVADGSRPTRLERARAHARTAHHPVCPCAPRLTPAPAGAPSQRRGSRCRNPTAGSRRVRSSATRPMATATSSAGTSRTDSPTAASRASTRRARRRRRGGPSFR